MTSIIHIERYARLENQRAELKDELVAVEAKLDELRQGVLDYMQSHSLDKITSAGRTLYLRRELWAGRAEGVSPADLMVALDAAGLTEFAERAPKMQSLTAFVRELDRDGLELPEPLRGVLVAHELFKIGSRRS